jgi:hypothetical protein
MVKTVLSLNLKHLTLSQMRRTNQFRKRSFFGIFQRPRDHNDLIERWGLKLGSDAGVWNLLRCAATPAEHHGLTGFLTFATDEMQRLIGIDSGEKKGKQPASLPLLEIEVNAEATDST